MFGPLGVPELIFILVLALLIFGPKRLPEIGRTIGKGMAEFRKASNDLKRSINTELALDEEPPVPSIVRPPRLEPPAMTAPRAPAALRPEPEPEDTPVPDGMAEGAAGTADAEAAEPPANEPLEPR